jgi:hypothetical protein
LWCPVWVGNSYVEGREVDFCNALAGGD